MPTGRPAVHAVLFAVLALAGCSQQRPPEPGQGRAKLQDWPLDTFADLVLGQTTLTGQERNGADATGLSGPSGVAVDRRAAAYSGAGTLYVADTENNRVLVWLDVRDRLSGKPADKVVGQPDFNQAKDLSRTGGCPALSPSTLCRPRAVAVDALGNLWVADSGNDRVVRFDQPTSPTFDNVARLVIDADIGAGAALLNPSGVALDPGAGTLFVSDTGHHRVLRFDLRPLNLTPPQPVLLVAALGQINTVTLATPPASPAAANKLLSPGGLAFDSTRGWLFVADTGYNRVLGFSGALSKASNAAADLVLGQGGSFTAVAAAAGNSGMRAPVSVAVDGAANLYVADQGNNRVLQFNAPSAPANADRVYGQGNSFSATACPNPPTATSACAPAGVATDLNNNLFVADSSNNRVLELVSPMDAGGDAADAVLGQARASCFAVNSMDAAALNGPTAVAIDRSAQPNRVYVSDTGNNRVLGWASAARLANGQPADVVIGQPDAHTFDCSVGRDRLCAPGALAVDSRGTLYVADRSNHRVLSFDRPLDAGAAANLKAARVFGQPTFADKTCAAYPGNLLCNPTGLALDADEKLLVADSRLATSVAPTLDGRDARLVRYDPRAQLTSHEATLWQPNLRSVAANADGIYLLTSNGALSRVPDLTGAANLTVTLSGARQVVAKGEHLYAVTSSGVARYSSYGQVFEQNFGATSPNARAYSLKNPSGAALDGAGNLFVADTDNARVVVFFVSGRPVVTAARIAPAAPLGGEALTASYGFSDPDGDGDQGAHHRWFLGGVHQPAFDGLVTLPGTAVRRGQSWAVEVSASDGALWALPVRSDPVSVGNGPPSAAALRLSPAAPTAADALNASWTYSDPEGDLAGTPVVRWFKDGTAQPQDATTLPAGIAHKGELWYFRVTPFDGTSYGPTSESGWVRVLNSPPMVRSASVAPAAPTSKDTLSVVKDLYDPDGDAVSTTVQWYRNGQPVTGGPSGQLIAGDTWHFKMVPSDGDPSGNATGPEYTSATVTVSPSLPAAADLAIDPVSPTSSTDLKAVYRFVPGEAATSEGASELTWYRSPAGGGQELPVRALTGPTVPATALSRGDTWRVTVRPFDGLLWGPVVSSRPVTIANSPPTIARLSVGPAAPRSGDALVATWVFIDADRDPEKVRIDWLRDDLPAGVTAATVHGSLVKRDQTWRVVVTPQDPFGDGPSASSEPITIGNAPPVASNPVITPAVPKVTEPLEASWGYSDAEDDPEGMSEVLWYRNGALIASLRNQRVNPSIRKGERWSFSVRPTDATELGAEVRSAEVEVVNSKPVAAQLAISPEAPMTGDPLTAGYRYSDADGDLEVDPFDLDPASGTRIQWLKDGLAVPGRTGRTLPAGVANRDEQWSFAIVVNDGFADGDEAVSAPVGIGNNPPVAANAVIGPVGPALPTRVSGLLATWDYADPDGDDQGATRVAWSVDGELKDGLKLPQVDAQQLRKGQSWTVTVTPYDGHGYGRPVTSEPVIVKNSPPTAVAKVEQPQYQATGALTRVQLDGSASSDPDEDSLVYRWTALKPDGTPHVLNETSSKPIVELWPGRHVITLTVTDNDPSPISASTEVNVEVSDVPPVLTAFEPDHLSVKPGRVILSGQGRAAFGDAPVYHWWQRDGVTTVEVNDADSETGRAWFFATQAGDRVFGLRAANKTTGTACADQFLTVTTEQVGPFAALEGMHVARIGEPIALDGRFSDDPNGDAVTHQWTSADPALELLDDRAPVALASSTMAGRYEIALTASDGAADSVPAKAFVHVVDPDARSTFPVAVLPPRLFGQVDAEVVIDASGSYSLDGSLLGYWLEQVEGLPVDFEQREALFRFTPPAAGDYVFELTVESLQDGSAAGAVSEPARVRVEVIDPAVDHRPVVRANLVNETAVPMGEAVVLDASRSADPDGDPLECRWTQTWGVKVNLFDPRDPSAAVPPECLGRGESWCGSCAVQPNFYALRPGLVRFEVLAVARGRESSPARVQVVVTGEGNQAPEAWLCDTRTDCRKSALVLHQVVLDGSGSFDPDGAPAPLSFRWLQLSGPPVPLDDADTDSARFTTRAPGRYVFQLIAFDGQAPSLPAEITVDVARHLADNLPPIARAFAPPQVDVGETVQLDGSHSGDPDALDLRALRFRWEPVSFPSDTPPVAADEAGATSATPAYRLEGAGDYTFRLVVSDGSLSSAPAYVNVRCGTVAGAASGSLGCSTGAAGALGSSLLAGAVALLALARRRRAPWVLLALALTALAACNGRSPEPQRPLARGAQALAGTPTDDSADLVLGQTSLFAGGRNLVEEVGFDSAGSLAVDESSTPARLYLADTNNHRILVWNDATAFPRKGADLVIGQPDLRSTGARQTSAKSLNLPRGVAVDGEGNLFVADSGNHRVLRFLKPGPAESYPAAVQVWGQATFQDAVAPTAACAAINDKMTPVGIAVERYGGRMVVADNRCARLIRFDREASPPGLVCQGSCVGFVARATAGGGSCSGPTASCFSSQLGGLALNESVSPSLVYLADSGYNRVVILSSDFADVASRFVLGQTGMTTSGAGVGVAQLSRPTAVALRDGVTFVADGSNSRVLAYATVAMGKTADATIGAPSCAAPAGLTTLCAPSAVAVAPRSGSTLPAVLVADGTQHRVLRFPQTGTSPLQYAAAADVLLGQYSPLAAGPNSIDGSSLSAPEGVAIDTTSSPRHVFVADTANHRVLGWRDADALTSGAPADLILGQTDAGAPNPYKTVAVPASRTTFNSPRGIFVDKASNLYVADTANNRVLMFIDPFGTDLQADRVFGQSSYTATVCTGGPAGLCAPTAVFVDGLAPGVVGNVFVADTGNQRAVAYPKADNSEFGTFASRAFGKASLTSVTQPLCATSPWQTTTLCSPKGLIVNSAGDLFVSDPEHNRVLVYWRAIGKPGSVEAADGVLGPDALGTVGNWPTSTFTSPTGLAIVDDRVYVAHAAGVTRYDRPISNPGGSSPVANVGTIASPFMLGGAAGMAVDPLGHLYVADPVFHRVAVFLANTRPVAVNVAIAPSVAITGDDLKGSYTFYDADGQAENLTLRRIEWYRSDDDGRTFALQPALSGLTQVNGREAGVDVVRRGQQWQVAVRPHDGLEYGLEVRSPPVRIGNGAPVAANARVVALSTSLPECQGGTISQTCGLQALWSYTDPENDAQADARIRWFRNGSPEPFDDPTIAAGVTRQGDKWHFEVTPFDGEAFGATVSSPVTIIANRRPSLTYVTIKPAAPTSSDTLTVDYGYQDPDGDGESGSLIRWFRNTAQVTALDNQPTAAIALHAAEQWQVEVVPRDGTDLGTSMRSAVVTIQATAPEAIDASILPASPTTASALRAKYTYVMHDYPESLSEITWRRDGQVVPEVANLASLPAGKASRGERWSFTVRPRDSRGNYGDPLDSAEVLIGNATPQIANLKLLPAEPRAGDVIEITYDFVDLDDTVDRSHIIWKRKGVVQDSLNDLKRLPKEVVVHGDTWSVEVTPRDANVEGTMQPAGPVTVLNTAPVASAVEVSPRPASILAPLKLTYAYADADGDAESGTVITWTVQGPLPPQPVPSNVKEIPAELLIRGQTWVAKVKPSDGLAPGAEVASAPLSIGNAPPTAVNVGLTPAVPVTGDALTVGYTFVDADRPADLELGTQIRWKRGGVEASEWNDLRAVPAGVVTRGEEWTVTVTPDDGHDPGQAVTFGPVPIGNKPPQVSNVRVVKVALNGTPWPEARCTDSIEAAFDFSDAENDSELGSRYTWYRNGAVEPKLANLNPLTPLKIADYTGKPLRRGDVWRVAVRPSDDRDFGAEVLSPPAASLTIANSPPTANAGSADHKPIPTTPTGSETTVRLDGTRSTDADADDAPNLAFRWTNDANTLLCESPTCDTDLPVGVHRITLTVTDPTGATGTDYVIYNVNEEPPVVSVEPAQQEVSPGGVQLQGIVFDKMDRSGVEVIWKQTGSPKDGVAEDVILRNASTTRPSFFAVGRGPRTFSFTARIGTQSSAPATATVVTRNLKPFAAFGPARQVVKVGEPAPLDGRESSDPNGDPLTYAWTLVDPSQPAVINRADQPQAELIAEEQGVFLVQLVVHDGLDASVAAQAEVVALPSRGSSSLAPRAVVTPYVYGRVGQPLELDGSASWDLEGEPLTYTWRQGSGPPAALSANDGVRVSFVPAEAGDYEFQLIVSDGVRESAAATLVAQVAPELNHLPVARFVSAAAPEPFTSGAIAAKVGDRVRLDGSRSMDLDADPLTWKWTQVSGPEVVLDDDASATPAFWALRPGRLVFELKVADGVVSSAPAYLDVLVTEGRNHAPEVDAAAPARALLFQKIQLDGGDSLDPDGEALRYAWEQIGGTPVALTGADAANPAFTPTVTGPYTFQLRVFDRQVGSPPKKVTVLVQRHGEDNVQPVAVASAPLAMQVNQTIQLDGTGSYDPDSLDTELMYRWSVIAFPTGQGVQVLETPEESTTNFTVTAPGDYTVRLVVADGELGAARFNVDGVPQTLDSYNLISEPVFVHITVSDPNKPAAEAGFSCSAPGGVGLLGALGLLALVRRRRG